MKKTIRNGIQTAFDPIRADQGLIDQTRSNVENTYIRQGKRPRRRSPLIRGLAFAAAFVFLVGIFTVAGLTLTRTTVAAVSVDINPSIELDINALNRVVSAKAFNADGTSLLATLDLNNLPVKNAVGKIVTAAAKAGYLAADGSSIIAITTSTDSEALKDKLELETEEAAQTALGTSGSEAVTYHDNTALARIAEAHDLGITPGRLNLIQKLTALDPTIDQNNYLDAKASEIMKEVVSLQNAQRNADKAAAKETQSSEQNAAKATQASEQAAAKETKMSEVDAAKASEKAAELEQAVNQAQANQAMNNPGQNKK
ncbi:MAG TPA: hypothetical protein VIL27_06625 [Clostridia bacterium]